MRIISKFRDYYDGVQFNGYDKSLVYVREMRILKLDRHARDPSTDEDSLRKQAGHLLPMDVFIRSKIPSGIGINKPCKDKSFNRLDIAFAMVVFAGKIYPFASIVRSSPMELPRQSTQSFVYDIEGVDQALIDHGSSLEQIVNKNPNIWDSVHNDFSAYRFDENNKSVLKNWFELSGSDKFSSLCTEHALACALWRTPSLTINPKLASVEFFRRMPHQQAFQEISMFLGNIAAPDLVPVTLEEKYRVQQHGFDPKYGFRKRPE